MNPLIANIQAIHANAAAEVRQEATQSAAPAPTLDKPEVVKGSVVKYKDGHMRVTARFKNHVNLGGVFAGKTSIKKVPLAEVSEDREKWYEEWSKSETYQCM
jgi:hypothetical protein